MRACGGGDVVSDVVEQAKDSLNTYDYAHACGCDPMYPAGLIRRLVAEVERLRPFSRCPRCSSTNTRAMTHEEQPIIVCDDCRYGT